MKPVMAAGPSAAKKETSKIPLEAAQPAAGPKKPTITTVKKATSPLDGASAEVVEQKRKTSRISLDSVLAADDSEKPGGDAGRPKTIKLKRPSEAVTVKAVKKGPAAPSAPAGDPSKTAPLDEAAAGAASTTTGRKTVKVRKPTMKVKKAGDASAGAPAAAGSSKAKEPEQVPYVDSAHWVFITLGIITFLVISVSIWMFTSQVIGPNYCLTQTSYSARAKDANGQPLPDLHRAGSTDLPWPGKLRKGPAR